MFRRHEAGCAHGYPKDLRVCESDSAKTTGRRQCGCSIYAEGTLRHGTGKRYLRPKSTGERDWNEARKVVAEWEQSGEPSLPLPAPAEPAYQLETVAEAVRHFLEAKQGQNTSPENLGQFRQLLELRLIPFANSKGIRYIQQMDSAQVWSEFRNSWRNLNPLRNKRPQPDQAVEALPVSPNTARRLIQQLREFIRLCISREWLSENWASREHGMRIETAVEPKEPFTSEELDAIYEATKLVTDGHGFRQKRVGQGNARELLVFLWVLRYTGLRISDVVMLETNQLVPFEHASYTFALYCHPHKTRKKRAANFVHIPLPNGNLPGHPDLVEALQSLPVKNGRYFFYGGKGKRTTNVSSWRNRINRLFKIAGRLLGERGLRFACRPHPHRFRHTFAATLLQNGVPLRVVGNRPANPSFAI